VRFPRIRPSLAEPLAIFLAASTSSLFLFAGKALAQEPPKYQVDPAWPKELPNNWIMGQVGGMAVDRHDHIWVLQRPGSNTVDELGASPASQRSQC
jgi:hypothetical protein